MVKLAPIALFNQRRRCEGSGEPTECQPATREELDAAPPTPVLGMLTVPLPETPLLQPAAVLAELSPVFDEVVSPQPAVVCVSASPRSRRLIVSGSTADLPSVRALPFTPVPEPVRLRRRWVPLWPLPPFEAEV